MPRIRRSDLSSKKSASVSRLDEEPGTPPPQQRNAANARERARMRVLSRAFCRLKTTLPWVPADTKLSKLDTLRLATSYIAHLKDSLLAPAAAAAAAAAVAAAAGEQTIQQSQTLHSNGLAWPLSLQPSLPEPWLHRRTSGCVPGTPTANGGSYRISPCSGAPLLPPLVSPGPQQPHGVPPSPPSSSGEADEDEDFEGDSDAKNVDFDRQWQMLRLYQRGCE